MDGPYASLMKLLRMKATRYDLHVVAGLAESLDGRDGVEVAFTAAKYSARFFPEELFRIAELLPRSVWYVKLMGEASYYQYFFSGKWFSYFLEGYLTTSMLPAGQRGLAYIFLAMYVKDFDEALARYLLSKGLDESISSPPGVVGGILLQAVKLAGLMGDEESISRAVEIAKVAPISKYEKVDIITEAAGASASPRTSCEYLRTAASLAEEISDPELRSAAFIAIRRTAKELGFEDIRRRAERALRCAGR